MRDSILSAVRLPAGMCTNIIGAGGLRCIEERFIHRRVVCGRLFQIGAVPVDRDTAQSRSGKVCDRLGAPSGDPGERLHRFLGCLMLDSMGRDDVQGGQRGRL